MPAALGDRAKALRAAGWSWSRIAAELELGRTTVRELCAKSEPEATGMEQGQTGPPSERACAKSQDDGGEAGG